MAADIVQTTGTSRAAWWRGTRGEWLVAVQLALMALVIFGPRTWPQAGIGPFQYAGAWSTAGQVLILAGAALAISGGLWLGQRNLTPLPAPREEGSLVETGPYRLVRHPMYAGGIVFACGWTLWVRGPLTLVYAAALAVFVDAKSRREERWLCAKFSGYAAYQKRVRKLVPFVY